MNRHKQVWILLLSVLAVGSGCESEVDAGRTYTVDDSAGTRIVVSDRPIWEEDGAWTVSAEPDLELGVFQGDERYQLDDVRGVTRLSDGRVVVLNGGDSQLRFYDGSGQFLKSVARAGDGPGELNRPTGLIRQQGDTLLVSTMADWEASWFTGEGEFVTRRRLDVAARGEALDSIWGCPSRPGLLPDGTLLSCVGRGAERNQHEAAPRVSHWLVRTPYDVSWVDTVGTAYGFSGSRSVSLRFAARPTMVTAGGKPMEIFIGDPAFFEIDVIRDREGRVGSIRYPNGLRNVGLAEQEAYEEYLRQRDPSSAGPGTQSPVEVIHASQMPGFRDLQYDAEGYVWAVEYTTPWEERNSALVFRTDGPLMGRIGLPEGFDVLEIGRDYVLGIWRDDLEVEYIRLYGLDRS